MSASGVYILIYSERCRHVKDKAHRVASMHQNAEIKATIMRNMQHELDHLDAEHSERMKNLRARSRQLSSDDE